MSSIKCCCNVLQLLYVYVCRVNGKVTDRHYFAMAMVITVLVCITAFSYAAAQS